MLNKVIAVVSLAVLLAAGSAFGQAPQPPAEQLLVSIFPKDWKVGFTDRKPGLTMVEYVPPGQTVENWDRMLTIQIFHGNPMTLPQFMGAMKGSHEQGGQCEQAKFNVVASKQVNGYDAALSMLVCTKHKQTGRGEFTFVQGLRGRDSFYVVQRAWRGAAYALDNVPLDDAEVKEWLTFMDKVAICDSRDPQRACPTPR